MPSFSHFRLKKLIKQLSFTETIPHFILSMHHLKGNLFCFYKTKFTFSTFNPLCHFKTDPAQKLQTKNNSGFLPHYPPICIDSCLILEICGTFYKHNSPILLKKVSFGEL
jgi:hypothetical protein